ncbi:MAG TPA: TlpA disulfide reductase family protein [Methylophilaceae bacterium]|nr:TlpA disulfide reductase family protein [Methylophilaceae bacterium]
MISSVHRYLIAWLLLLVCGSVFAAPDFGVIDTAGKQHRLSDYRGKWLLVNYWATWCPPCLEEIPDLVALYDERHDKDLMVLGVAMEYKSGKEVAEYVDDMLMSYPIVLGNESVMAQIGSAEVLPTTYIFDPRGQLVATRHGLITKEYVEGLIAAE